MQFNYSQTLPFAHQVMESASMKVAAFKSGTHVLYDAMGVQTTVPLDPSVIHLLPATREGWGPKSLSAFKSPL